MRALFISDLHLSAADRRTSQRFDAFMAQAVPGADALYILGDLFHVWLGDDLFAHDDYARHIAGQLRQASAQGTRIFIGRGNRDFMLGPRFAEACGGELLAERTLIELGHDKVLLLHGDELCLDDRGYQRMRRILRSPLFYTLANRLPIAWRRRLAARIQHASAQGKRQKSMAIMDVNAGAVADAFTQSGASQLIHGHTHRPARHPHPHPQGTRWVLCDWQQDAGYLEWQDGAFRVHAWPDGPYNHDSLGG